MADLPIVDMTHPAVSTWDDAEVLDCSRHPVVDLRGLGLATCGESTNVQSNNIVALLYICDT